VISPQGGSFPAHGTPKLPHTGSFPPQIIVLGPHHGVEGMQPVVATAHGRSPPPLTTLMRAHAGANHPQTMSGTAKEEG